MRAAFMIFAAALAGLTVAADLGRGASLASSRWPPHRRTAAQRHLLALAPGRCPLAGSAAPPPADRSPPSAQASATSSRG